MKILAFDTTNSLASVSLKLNDEIIFNKILHEESKQAEKLFQLINEALTETNNSFDELDMVAVTNGPGSFTGVRIGLAAALGMKMFSKAQFFALSNFQVLAYNAKDLNKDIMVILDARREQVYYQLFSSSLKPILDAQLCSIDKIKIPDNTLLVGDGARFIEDNSYEKMLLTNPDAVMLANCAQFYYENNEHSELSPLYIREPDITIKQSAV